MRALLVIDVMIGTLPPYAGNLGLILPIAPSPAGAGMLLRRDGAIPEVQAGACGWLLWRDE